jgi:hypothetical protein
MRLEFSRVGSNLGRASSKRPMTTIVSSWIGSSFPTLRRLGFRRFPTLFTFVHTSFRKWSHGERPWAMHRPFVTVSGARPPGAILQSRGSLGAGAHRRKASVGDLIPPSKTSDGPGYFAAISAS